MNTVDAEVIQTQAVAVRPPMSVGQAMGVDEIIAQVRLVQDVMKRVMTEGEHYGTIPGCGDKKVLLQPGAQKLTMTFRLAPEYQIQEVNLERGHKEYRVICTLKSIGSGAFVGQGVGCCSSMESKYRFRGGARKCPECGKESIIKGKKEYGGGWLCWDKKGGCGHKWPDGAPEIESQSIDKVENENPADCFNTVLKMGKKRAFVDATITATAASDIFTQDLIEEGEASELESPKAPYTASQPSKVQTPTQSPKPAPSPKPATAALPFPTPDSLAKMISQLGAGPGQSNRALISEFFQKAACILPTESLEELPLRFVPATAKQMRELGECIAEFEGGSEAALPYPPHPEPDTVKEAVKKPVEVPREEQVSGDFPEWFMDVIVPVPRKGMKRDEYLKHPDSIGSLFQARHEDTADGKEARQRLWGFVNNYEAKGWTKTNGTQVPPSDADKEFRVALDAFADWFAKNHPGEKL